MEQDLIKVYILTSSFMSYSLISLSSAITSHDEWDFTKDLKILKRIKYTNYMFGYLWLLCFIIIMIIDYLWILTIVIMIIYLPWLLTIVIMIIDHSNNDYCPSKSCSLTFHDGHCLVQSPDRPTVLPPTDHSHRTPRNTIWIGRNLF